MNRTKVLWVAAAIIVLMALFPTFVHRRAEYKEALGYSFILAPPQWRPHPEHIPEGFKEANAMVDTTMLLTQIVVVLVLTGLVYFAISERKD
jgi:uncharacterized membrane protein YesL